MNLKSRLAADWQTFKVGFKRPQIPVWGYLVILVLGAAAWLLPSYLIVTKTPSVNAFLFLKQELSPASFARDNYLLFDHEVPEWQGDKKGSLFLKRVGCLPGEEIRMTESLDFYCNEIYLGRALKEDSKGRKLEITSFRGVLPEGKYFMMGDILKSWDSRYFGPVDQADFRLAATPIF
ncbi:MAG: S26 family signal peptidase [Desulfuromonadales bacterium]|nr:S26 family signal peptidase [Desulfuromonadales bacterium]MBN2793245.1 S26 family signal peptidase [Desulfuromonadales bacterium]